jgi:hypothetical protein
MLVPPILTLGSLAIFYSINVLAVGFASILAYGIMQLNGKAGLLAWRW